MTTFRRFAVALTVAFALFTSVLPAQQVTLTPAETQRRRDLEARLQEIAVVERRVMIPMKDGVRLATDIYRPKNAAGKVPIIFVKTPYNMNFWDVRNGVPADMSRIIEAIEKLLNGAQTALVQEDEETGFRLLYAGTDTVRMVRESLRPAERVDKPVEVPLSMLARALLREGRELIRFKKDLLPKLPGLLDRVEWMLDRRTP